jgi:choline dehydrogenase
LAFRSSWLKRYVSGVFGIVVILGKPLSRGSIGLNSADPAEPARIDPAYYKDKHDKETMLAGLNKAREIAAQSALVQAGAKPLSLGGKNASKEKIWKWAAAATMTTFHFCGSCRMGDDVDSPVDTQLRVKGLRNVRVADASVMPEIPVSALNAPSMMIGYRAANFILEGTRS